MIILRVL